MKVVYVTTQDMVNYFVLVDEKMKEPSFLQKALCKIEMIKKEFRVFF